MAETLDKYYEADNIPEATTGAGVKYKDFPIPADEVWTLDSFGGSSNQNSTEVELLYSQDNGATWINPYDSGATKIRCLHLQQGNVSKVFLNGLDFEGGAQTILRVSCKNYNYQSEAEIATWFYGVIKKAGV